MEWKARLMTARELPASEPEKARGLTQTVGIVAFVIGIIAAIVINLTVDPPSAWGLVPIVLYAILALVGIDIVLATLGALIAALIMTGTGPIALGGLLADSLGSFIVTVGLIIILGGGLGQVTRETGVAEYLVRIITQTIGLRTRAQVQLGVMLTSTILVGALGTLAGANAILAPIVIPIAAAVGFTPAALAVMLHSGGAPGLFIGPFTPPVVTLTGTTGVDYLAYLAVAGLPMAVTTWGVGFFMARWIQRRTEGLQAYDEETIAEETRAPLGDNARRGAIAFALTLGVMVLYGIWNEAGASFAILVLFVTSFTTGLAARMSLEATLQAIYRGAAGLIWLFLLFWLFNPLIELVGQMEAYEALLEVGEPILSEIGGYGFALLALVIGWLGVAGAAVAQVVLMDEVFGPTAEALGIPALAWVLVLLGSSQIDWFGPFPNADMIGQMGLARSRDLRSMLYNGWAILAANLVVFMVILWILI